MDGANTSAYTHAWLYCYEGGKGLMRQYGPQQSEVLETAFNSVGCFLVQLSLRAIFEVHVPQGVASVAIRAAGGGTAEVNMTNRADMFQTSGMQS